MPNLCLFTRSMPQHDTSSPQAGRWDAVDNYLVCISECSLDDGACVTHCMEVHLKPEDNDIGAC